jgi:hypothetical protein
MSITKDEFDAIDTAIDALLKKLAKAGHCPDCVGTALMYRGAFLHADFTGLAETQALCEEISSTMVDYVGDAEASSGELATMPISGTQH